jgi:hypothetical protein
MASGLESNVGKELGKAGKPKLNTFSANTPIRRVLGILAPGLLPVIGVVDGGLVIHATVTVFNDPPSIAVPAATALRSAVPQLV